MFVRKSTHERLVAEAVEAETKRMENKYAAEIYDLQVQKGELHRQLDVANGRIKERDEKISEMTPAYDLGMRRKAISREYNQRKAAERKAAKEAK